MAGMMIAGPAAAVQPLGDFLSGARTHSFDAREADATAKQRDWEQGAAMGRLLPSLSARGVLQYNQYEVAVPFSRPDGSTQTLTITPQGQVDGFFQLDVPIVDLANYYRYGQAKHIKEAAEAQKALVGTDLDKAVVRSYFVYLGASALANSASRSLTSALDNEAYVKTRHELGVATDLDAARASANVERAKQDQADAEFGRLIAARNLETLSGVSPTEVTAFPIDDLHPEQPLSYWMEQKDTPTDKVQKKLYEASVSAKNAASSALLPTLSANAQERLTNATGFSGQASTYTLQAVLSWRLDYSTYATAEAQAAASEIQKIKAERSRRGVEDSFYDTYRRIETGIAKSASARAQVKAADRAAELSVARYQAGALTQLDVTQSQKDAFQAQAARIQADADLLYSRALLRILAGQDPQGPIDLAPLVDAPVIPSPVVAPAPAPAPASEKTVTPAEAQ